MPSYAYTCATHGSFTAHRPMADFAQPCACPVCGAASDRAMAVPMMAVVASAPGQAATPAKAHAAGCSCCASGRARSPAATAAVAAATRSGAPKGGLFAGI